MKKYRLLDNDTKIFFGRKHFRIQALISFGDVKEGDLGGYIEKEENLAHEGNAWVSGDAQVYGNARVSGNAQVCGNARVSGNEDILCVKGIGSAFRHTTVCMTKSGEPFVSCGCFCGTLAEFEAKVKKTHGDSKYAREYQLFIELVKLHFDMEGA